MQKAITDIKVRNELDIIKERLDVLTILYKNILDALVKTGKVMPDEKKAIEAKERLMSEAELHRALKA